MTQILEEPSYISLHSIFANMDPEVCFDFTAALDASDVCISSIYVNLYSHI
jgi:hypothetical protein